MDKGSPVKAGLPYTFRIAPTTIPGIYTQNRTSIRIRCASGCRYFGGLTDLGGRLDPAVFCKNLPLSEHKHNTDKTDKAADKRTDNLDECRRLKNTYKSQPRHCDNYGSEPTQLFQHI
jgi:hypothetical protein